MEDDPDRCSVSGKGEGWSLHVLSERSILRQRDVVAAAGYSVLPRPEPPHAHEFMEVVVVRTGTAVHRMQSGSCPISVGSLLLVRPGQWHAYDDPRDFEIWNVYIPAKTLSGELAALRSHPVLAAFTSARVTVGGVPATRASQASPLHGDRTAPGQAPVSLDLKAIEPYLTALAQPSRSTDRSLTRLAQLLAVLDVLAPAFTFVAPGQSIRGTHPAVIAATELLDTAPDYPWRLADLAERVHISAPHLCRLFTRDIGISPLHYLERHRLELTSQLLLEGDLSIGQISNSAGWSDTNYMARRFRAAHGMSPTRYRTVFQQANQRR